MVVRVVPPPRGVRRRLAMRPLLRKGPPSPTQKSVRTQVCLAPRARPDATLASDFARPADKSAPHTTARARSESQAGPRGAHATLADSIVSIARKAARSDRFAP